MDTQKTLKIQKTENILLSDKHYYNYVFKKTEKIICAVFYILHKEKDTIRQTQDTVLDIKDSAKKTLDAVLRSLSTDIAGSEGSVLDIVAKLIALDSHLRVGESVGILREELAAVLHAEIDGVLRTLRTNYTKDTSHLFNFEYEPEKDVRGSVAHGIAKKQSPSPQRATTHATRQDQIKAIISDKKIVSIKDLSEDIKDCSEKTIQRELNDMIEKSIIKREGERRWSRYSLI